MEKTYKDLANLVPKTDEPTLYIGFAEAATALGQGVYEQSNQENSFYMQSTRFKTSKEQLFSFEELHSHASHHIFYKPHDEDILSICKNITRIVLVDDEISTGKTAENIVIKLKEIFPDVSKYYLVSVINFSKNNSKTLECLSLCDASYTFDRNNLEFDDTIVSVSSKKDDINSIIPYNFSRYGVKKLNLNFENYIDLNILKDKKVLVLGTAEFTYPPYLYAKYLEENGVDAYCQSTTRSPINIDGDISSVIKFKDNYHESIDNFLYNVSDRDYDYVILCYETISLPKNFTLKEQLENKFKVMEIFFEI